MRKQIAKSLDEVKNIVQEAFARGESQNYDHVLWFLPTGTGLCISKMRENTFDLIGIDGQAIEIVVDGSKTPNLD